MRDDGQARGRDRDRWQVGHLRQRRNLGNRRRRDRDAVQRVRRWRRRRLRWRRRRRWWWFGRAFRGATGGCRRGGCVVHDRRALGSSGRVSPSRRGRPWLSGLIVSPRDLSGPTRAVRLPCNARRVRRAPPAPSSELGCGASDLTDARCPAARRRHGVEAGQLSNDLLRTSSQVNCDAVDDRRQGNSEPACRESRHRQDDERSQKDELLPAPDRRRIDQAGPHVECRRTVPQHLDTPSRRQGRADNPLLG